MDQLQELDSKFDIAQAAHAQLELAVLELCGNIGQHSAAHGLSRISRLIGQVAVNVPHADIAEAVELVAFLRRERDGSRRLAEIVRPAGHDGGRYLTEPA